MTSEHQGDPAAPLPPPPPGAGPAPAPAPAPIPAPPPPPPPLGDAPTVTDWMPPPTPVPPPVGAPATTGWGTPGAVPTGGASGRSMAPFVIVALVALGLVGGGIGFAALTAAPAATPAPTAAAVATPEATTPRPADSAAPTVGATPEPSDAPLPDVSPDPDATPVFGTAEDVAALRALVPGDIRPGCTSTAIYGNQVAALRCEVTGAASLYYELYPDRGRLDRSWQAMLDNNGLTEGSGACGSGEAGETGWYYEGNDAGEDEGRDACYVEDDGTATFLWTDFTTLTRGWLFGKAGDSIKDVRPVEPGRPGHAAVIPAPPGQRSGRPS